jgi:uncharacterized YigZ family protein
MGSVQDADACIARLRKEFHDARHVCYAYRIGKEGALFRAFDDGEPSGTAGKPILGQILSANLTNVLIVVVRYFGGTLLGTSGLIVAYKTAAKMSLDNASIISQFWTETIDITFDARQTNRIMQMIKSEDAHIIAQTFDVQYHITLQIRTSRADWFRQKITEM